MQVCTNTGRQVARKTKFCIVAPNICGCSLRDLLEFVGGFYINGKFVHAWSNINWMLREIGYEGTRSSGHTCA